MDHRLYRIVARSSYGILVDKNQARPIRQIEQSGPSMDYRSKRGTLEEINQTLPPEKNATWLIPCGILFGISDVKTELREGVGATYGEMLNDNVLTPGAA